MSEFFYQLASAVNRFPWGAVTTDCLHGLALRSYQRAARKHLRRSLARIYHVRGGYGGSSINEARSRDMLTLVDHSIPEPHALLQLVSSGGHYVRGLRPPLPLLWRLVAEDLRLADMIVVNSGFVKQTLTDSGVDPGRIVVLYWGVDADMEAYLSAHPTDRCSTETEVRFLFVGSVGKRKGADVLLHIFGHMGPPGWRLTVAGPIDGELAGMAATLRDSRIRILGPVSRDGVARLMLSHHVLVLPSLAEGSARVVFEAMAAGMAVITTPNAGSVVEDGVHGLLVEPGSAASFARAVDVLLGPDRRRIAEYGRAAQALVCAQYNSGAYRAKVVTLYRELALRCSGPTPSTG